jgi:DNA mismatch repair protein MSH5
MSSAGALLDHLVRESAVADLEDKGISGLLIRDIEALALCVRFRISSLCLADVS